MKRMALFSGIIVLFSNFLWAQLPPPLVNAVTYWDTTASIPNDAMKGDSLVHFFHGNWQTDSFLIYQPDSGGNYTLRESVRYFWGSGSTKWPDSVIAVTEKALYTHTASGNVEKLQYYYWTGATWYLSREKRYYYSSNNALDSIIELVNLGGNLDSNSRTMFSYNSGGKLATVKSLKWDWNASQWKPEDSISLLYNGSNGRLDSILIFAYDQGTWQLGAKLKILAYESSGAPLFSNHPQYHNIGAGGGWLGADLPDPEDYLYAQVFDGITQYQSYVDMGSGTMTLLRTSTVSSVGPYEEKMTDSSAYEITTVYYRFYQPPTGLNRPTPAAFKGQVRQTTTTIEVTDIRPIVGVAVANPQGQLLFGRIGSRPAPHQEVNIAALPAGSYFLTLMYEDGKYATISFVK